MVQGRNVEGVCFSLCCFDVGMISTRLMSAFGVLTPFSSL